MKRICTSCQPKIVDALYVATGLKEILGYPLQWFECGNHEPTDNLAGVTRVSLIPIDEWLKLCHLETT